MKTKEKKKPLNKKLIKELTAKFEGIEKTEPNGRKTIEFNKIVNYNKDERSIEVLDDCFDYGKGFMGCTGSRFDIISKAEYKERTSKENVIDSIMDCGLDSELFKREGANGVYKAMKANNEIDSFVFDNSYSELHDYLRKELKLTKNEAFTFSCSGGGRCFEKDYQGNINPELSEIIREYEG